MNMEVITKTEKPTFSFDEALSVSGFGKFNLYVLLASGLCLMCVIVETMCMMFIIPVAQCDLNLSLMEKGILSSISFFGVTSSSYVWGFIGDTRGRRKVLLQSLLLSSIMTFICSFIAWNWLFIILRYFNGLFLGGASTVVYAFAGEFQDNKHRPKVISWMSTFVAGGNIFLAGLAWIILPQEWAYEISYLNIVFKPWRLLIIIYGLPSLFAAFLLYCLPESPKYLLTLEEHDKVLEILKKIYYVNTGQNKQTYPVTELTLDELNEKVSQNGDGCLSSMWKQTAPLFHKNFIAKTLMVSFLQFGIFISNAGLTMWYPEILNKMSHYNNEFHNKSVTLCSAILYEEKLELTDFAPAKTCKDTIKTEVFQVSILVACAYAAVYICIGSLINILGKKPLLIGLFATTTMCGLVSQFVEGYTVIQLLIGIFLLGGAGIGVVNAITVDLFPTQIRAVAISVALMFGRFGAVSGTNIAGPLIFSFCDSLFIVITFVHIALITVVVCLPSTQRLPKLT